MEIVQVDVERLLDKILEQLGTISGDIGDHGVSGALAALKYSEASAGVIEILAMNAAKPEKS